MKVAQDDAAEVAVDAMRLTHQLDCLADTFDRVVSWAESEGVLNDMLAHGWVLRRARRRHRWLATWRRRTDV